MDENTIKFAVWDEDPGNDDLVGEGVIDLNQIKESRNFEGWVEIKYNGRKAGEVKFNISYLFDTPQVKPSAKPQGKPEPAPKGGKAPEPAHKGKPEPPKKKK